MSLFKFAITYTVIEPDILTPTRTTKTKPKMNKQNNNNKKTQGIKFNKLSHIENANCFLIS